MFTLKVHGESIAWPDDFAYMMMNLYKQHGIPFLVQNAADTGRKTVVEGVAIPALLRQR